MEAAEALGPAQVWNLAPHRVPENSGALQWHVSVPPPPHRAHSSGAPGPLTHCLFSELSLLPFPGWNRNQPS